MVVSSSKRKPTPRAIVWQVSPVKKRPFLSWHTWRGVPQGELGSRTSRAERQRFDGAHLDEETQLRLGEVLHLVRVHLVKGEGEGEGEGKGGGEVGGEGEGKEEGER
tara:strand:+ start:272 stop:592 length:321 start_codon:yes stop_codon:yes gene_type:complete